MTQLAVDVSLESLQPGTVLRVKGPIYDHVVLLAEYAFVGDRTVISFGPEGYRVTPLSMITANRAVQVDGYLGQLLPLQVLARARDLGAKWKYSWFSRNCEHFVRAAHGVRAESPQVQRAIALSAGLLFLSAARA